MDPSPLTVPLIARQSLLSERRRKRGAGKRERRPESEQGREGGTTNQNHYPAISDMGSESVRDARSLAGQFFIPFLKEFTI